MSHNRGHDKADCFFSIVLLGDSGVGKSSLLSRYIDDFFDSRWLSTIILDIRNNRIERQGVRVDLRFADTPGQKRFRRDPSFHNLSPGGKGEYYDGAMIVFDATNPASYDSVKNMWLPTAKKLLKPNRGAAVLVANKSDGDLTPSSEEVTDARFASLNLDGVVRLFETSATDSFNVSRAFDHLIDHCLAMKLGSPSSYIFEEGLGAGNEEEFFRASLPLQNESSQRNPPQNSFRPDIPPRIDPNDWATAKKMATIKAKAIKSSDNILDSTEYTFTPRLMKPMKPPLKKSKDTTIRWEDDRRQQQTRQHQEEENARYPKETKTLLGSDRNQNILVQQQQIAIPKPVSSSTSPAGKSPSVSSPLKLKTQEMPIEEAYERGLITGTQYQRLLFRQKPTVLVRTATESPSNELNALKHRMKSKRTKQEINLLSYDRDNLSPPVGDRIEVSIEDAFERGLISAKEYEFRLSRGQEVTITVPKDKWDEAEASLREEKKRLEAAKINSSSTKSSVNYARDIVNVPNGRYLSIEDAFTLSIITAEEYQVYLERNIENLKISEDELAEAEKSKRQTEEKSPPNLMVSEERDEDSSALPDAIDITIEDAWERNLISTKGFQAHLQNGVQKISVSKAKLENAQHYGLARRGQGLQPESLAIENSCGGSETRFREIKSLLANPGRIIARIATLEEQKELAVDAEDFVKAASIKKELETLRDNPSSPQPPNKGAPTSTFRSPARILESPRLAH